MAPWIGVTRDVVANPHVLIQMKEVGQLAVVGTVAGAQRFVDADRPPVATLNSSEGRRRRDHVRIQRIGDQHGVCIHAARNDLLREYTHVGPDELDGLLDPAAVVDRPDDVNGLSGVVGGLRDARALLAPELHGPLGRGVVDLWARRSVADLCARRIAARHGLRASHTPASVVAVCAAARKRYRERQGDNVPWRLHAQSHGRGSCGSTECGREKDSLGHLRTAPPYLHYHGARA